MCLNNKYPNKDSLPNEGIGVDESMNIPIKRSASPDIPTAMLSRIEVIIAVIIVVNEQIILQTGFSLTCFYVSSLPPFLNIS